MRISDWSSDVCSSDLYPSGHPPALFRGDTMTMTVSAGATAMDMTAMREVLAAGPVTPVALIDQAIARAEAVNPELNFHAWPALERTRAPAQIGRASCRDSVSQHVYIPVGAEYI